MKTKLKNLKARIHAWLEDQGLLDEFYGPELDQKK